MFAKIKSRFHSSDLLILLVLFHLVFNTLWISINNAPPRWDEAFHTSTSIKYSYVIEDFLNGNGFSAGYLHSVLSNAYAPLTQILAGIIQFIFSPSIKLAQWTATLFFAGTIIITYLLGREVTKSDKAGLIAAFVFSFYQIIYDNSRWLLLDIPLTFFVTLTTYLLVKSEYLSHKKYTFLAALSSLFVALTKIQGIVYLLIPFIYIVLTAAKKKNIKNVSSLVSGLVLAITLALPWIVINIPSLVQYYPAASSGEPLVDPQNLLNVQTWLFYIKLFNNNTLTLILLAPLLGASWFFFRTKAEYKWLLIIQVIVIYIAFTIFPNKDLRFLFPIFPLTAIIFGRGADLLWQKHKKLGQIILSYLLLVNLVLYLSLSFGWPLKKGHVSFVVLPLLQDITIFNLTDYPVRTYSKDLWPQEKILNDLASQSNNEPTSLLFIPNYDYFNDNNFRMYATLLDHQEIQVTHPGGQTELSHPQLNSIINNHKYILYTPNEVGVFYQPDKKAFEQIQLAVTQLLDQNQAQVLEKYSLPTGQEVWLVEKTQ